MILNFWNPSTFAHETADFKLACLQSAVSWAKNDGFKKFNILVVCSDLIMESDKKRYQFLLVFYGFESSWGSHPTRAEPCYFNQSEGDETNPDFTSATLMCNLLLIHPRGYLGKTGLKMYSIHSLRTNRRYWIVV